VLSKFNPIKFAFKKDGVISMAQEQMMENERGNAIKRYRELKERRTVDGRA
jgi:hypothetical protein